MKKQSKTQEGLLIITTQNEPMKNALRTGVFMSYLLVSPLFGLKQARK